MKYKDLIDYIDFFRMLKNNPEKEYTKEYSHKSRDKFKAIIQAFFYDESENYNHFTGNNGTFFIKNPALHIDNNLIAKLYEQGDNFDASHLSLVYIKEILIYFQYCAGSTLDMSLYTNGVMIPILQRLKELDNLMPLNLVEIRSGIDGYSSNYKENCYKIEQLDNGEAIIYSMNKNNSNIKDSWNILTNLSKEKTDEFFKKIKKLNRYNWKTRYYSLHSLNSPFLDLRMYGDGIVTRKIHCSNEFPSFAKMVENYVNEIVSDFSNEETYSYGIKKHILLGLDEKYIRNYYALIKGVKLNSWTRYCMHQTLGFEKTNISFKITNDMIAESEDEELEKDNEIIIDITTNEKLEEFIFNILKDITQIKNDLNIKSNNLEKIKELLYNADAYNYLNKRGKEICPIFDINMFELVVSDYNMQGYFSEEDLEMLLSEILSFVKQEFPIDLCAVRQHYANELFLAQQDYIKSPCDEDKEKVYYGKEGFVWRYIARYFTHEKFPINEESFDKKYDELFESKEKGINKYYSLKYNNNIVELDNVNIREIVCDHFPRFYIKY